MQLSVTWVQPSELLAIRVKRVTDISGGEEALDATELALRREVKGEDILRGFRDRMQRLGYRRL